MKRLSLRPVPTISIISITSIISIIALSVAVQLGIMAALPGYSLARPSSALVTVFVAEPSVQPEGYDFGVNYLLNRWDMDRTGDLLSLRRPSSLPTVSDGVWSITCLESGWVRGSMVTSAYTDPVGEQEIGITPNTYPGVLSHNYTVDADKYGMLSFRLKANTGDTLAVDSSYFWFNFGTPLADDGWHTYSLWLNWSGDISGARVRLYSLMNVGEQLSIDWARLVPSDEASPQFNVTGTASGGTTIRLYAVTDNADTSACNGPEITPAAGIPSSTTYNFTWDSIPDGTKGTLVPITPAALPPGTYYVCAQVDGLTPVAYSNAVTINSVPDAEIVAPGPTSGTDFALTALGNPWNMNDWGDVRWTYGVINTSILNGAFRGTATTIGPIVAFLYGGASIDASKYRYLTMRSYVPGRTAVDFSNMRLGWSSSIPIYPSTVIGSNDIVIPEFSAWVTYQVDLKYLENESETTWAWNGYYPPSFGIFPHEQYCDNYTCPTWDLPAYFMIDYVLLTRDNTANSAYDISLNVSDPEGDPLTITFYYTATPEQYNPGGTYIGETYTGIPVPPGYTYVFLPMVFGPGSSSAGREFSYRWNTSGVPAGSYYIWVKIEDGYNTIWRRSYLPIVVSH